MRFRICAKMGDMDSAARFTGIAKRVTLPGWVLVGWAAIEMLHTGGFAVDKITAAYDFLGGHPIYLLLAGLVWIFGWAAWPEYIKPWWPSWLRFTTMHERVHALHHVVMEPETGHCDRIKAAEKRLALTVLLTDVAERDRQLGVLVLTSKQEIDQAIAATEKRVIA
jgi:hypothetical protein